jgi:hypothetical protein
MLSTSTYRFAVLVGLDRPFNIGWRNDFVIRWWSAFAVGWPIATSTAYVAMPFARSLTQRIRTDMFERRRRLAEAMGQSLRRCPTGQRDPTVRGSELTCAKSPHCAGWDLPNLPSDQHVTGKV